MKKNVLFALVAAFVAIQHDSAAQTPLLYYNFESNVPGTLTNGTVIDNLLGADGTYRTGTLGGTGSIFNGGLVSGGDLGRSLQLTPLADANTNLEAPNINTNFTATALSIGTANPYTAMAWVRFANQTGDNMVFGQAQAVADQAVLHLGSRLNQYWDGHWADDINSGTTLTQPNTWHHVAFTNTAAGTQTIYVDGVVRGTGPGDNAGGPTVGQMVQTLNVVIGTAGNAGSFSGAVDEVKIYNQVLTQAQIQQAAVIPEPTSIVLLAASGLALMLRRRRPQA